MSDAFEAAAERKIAEAKLKAELVKPTMDEIQQAIIDEIIATEGSQRARLMGGMIDEPMPSQILKIVRLEAANRFFDACKYQPREVARRLNSMKTHERH